jgi:hypothetical protein
MYSISSEYDKLSHKARKLKEIWKDSVKIVNQEDVELKPEQRAFLDEHTISDETLLKLTKLAKKKTYQVLIIKNSKS